MMRTIPSSGEAMPAVGLGTWITFNVGDDPVLRDECADVMAAFFEAAGRLINSSPMYGSSQPVIGYGLEKFGQPKTLFSAEKVWTSSAAGGPEQIERSRQLLERGRASTSCRFTTSSHGKRIWKPCLP